MKNSNKGINFFHFKNKAMTAIEPIALALFDRLGPALEAGSEKFRE